jgi:hypothetical protein
VYANPRPLCDGTVNQTILAMHVLAHESWHMYGVEDEPTTDCYALQTVALVADRLGASRDFAGALGAYYIAHYPRIRAAPPGYESDECRDGGELDLRPAVTVWPG